MDGKESQSEDRLQALHEEAIVMIRLDQRGSRGEGSPEDHQHEKLRGDG